MKSILMCCDWFYPAYKAGGPIQSIHRLAINLSPFFNIYILTSAYDLNESSELKGIVTNCWVNHKKNIHIYYCTRQQHSVRRLEHILQDLKPNAFYFYSPFSKKSTIDMMRAARRIKLEAKFILAPRGTLKTSALRKSKFKKFIYLHLIKLTGIHKKFNFHCTNQVEKVEVEKIFGPVQSFVIDNLPPIIETAIHTIEKKSNTLKMICIGRFHPIKNIHFILELIKQCDQQIQLSIVGGLEDEHYFLKCQNLIKELPAHMTVHIEHDVPHNDIQDRLIGHHIMILPTLGENYGNAIIEALAVGRPVMISDQTPWKNLQSFHAGWDLALNNKQAWINYIKEAASWDQHTFDIYCQGAINYAQAHTNNEELVKKYIEMFSV